MYIAKTHDECGAIGLAKYIIAFIDKEIHIYKVYNLFLS